MHDVLKVSDGILRHAGMGACPCSAWRMEPTSVVRNMGAEVTTGDIAEGQARA